MWLEISKQGSKKANEAIDKGNYNKWNESRIRRAFNFGNGTMKDFERYMKDNKDNAWFRRV